MSTLSSFYSPWRSVNLPLLSWTFGLCIAYSKYGWRVNCGGNAVLTNHLSGRDQFCVLVREVIKRLWEKTKTNHNHKSTLDSIIWWSVNNIIAFTVPALRTDNCLTRESIGRLTALTSVRKKPHFHTRHIKEQNKHDTIESDLLNLSHPHRWPLLWLMRSVDHECLRFCSAWLMVTFGCLGALSKSVPHTQWPAAGALTMAWDHSGHTHFQLWLTILASSPAPMKLEIIRAVSGDKSLSVCSCHFPRNRTDRRREETLFDGTWRLTSSPSSFKSLTPQRWTQSVAWGWLF